MREREREYIAPSAIISWRLSLSKKDCLERESVYKKIDNKDDALHEPILVEIFQNGKFFSLMMMRNGLPLLLLAGISRFAF